MTCDRFSAAVIESGTPHAALDSRPDLRVHLESCRECRRWFDAFLEGRRQWDGIPGPTLAETVVARTCGVPCDRARVVLASAVDEPMLDADAALAEAHLQRCQACRGFQVSLAEVQAGLAALADMDPGFGFVPSVLNLTSRRPVRAARLERVRRWGRALLARPRFAWEAAYVLTLCWLLVFGHPITALDWTTARVSAIAARDLPAPVRATQERLLTLRMRVASDIKQAAGALPGPRETAAATARSLQERAVAGWAQATSWVPAWLDGAWRAMVEWFQGLVTDATEPTAPPARSSQ